MADDFVLFELLESYKSEILEFFYIFGRLLIRVHITHLISVELN